jgi:transglutaminase-like putative cysteine protease
VTPTSFNLGESENLLVRLRRFGGRHPLSVWETLVLLGISLLGFYIISILHPPKAPTAPAFSKDVRYRITLRNTLNRPVSQAGVWLPAPVAEEAARRCERIQVDHPHELIPDVAGNQVIFLPISHLAPFGSRVIQVGARVSLSTVPGPVRLPSGNRWLRPEKYIESDSPQVKQLAAELRAADPLQTAERMFTWVSSRVRHSGFGGPARGALQALSTRTGDCTEQADLFVALCRAAGIPARPLGGFICPESAVLKSHEFHNWAEFHHGGAWQLADPQRRVFRSRHADYVAMRIVTDDAAGLIPRDRRLWVKGEGLEVRMD